MTTPEVTDVKAALTTGLTELRLPTVRHCYEETARLAERETLSYERYLLQLVTRECEDSAAEADRATAEPIAHSGRESIIELQPEAAAAKSGDDHEDSTGRRVPGSS